MEGVLPLLLAWQMDGKEMGKFTKAEWVNGTGNLKCVDSVIPLHGPR